VIYIYTEKDIARSYFIKHVYLVQNKL